MNVCLLPVLHYVLLIYFVHNLLNINVLIQPNSVLYLYIVLIYVSGRCQSNIINNKLPLGHFVLLVVFLMIWVLLNLFCMFILYLPNGIIKTWYVCCTDFKVESKDMVIIVLSIFVHSITKLSRVACGSVLSQTKLRKWVQKWHFHCMANAKE